MDRFLSASLDRWLTTPPHQDEPDPYMCDHCLADLPEKPVDTWVAEHYLDEPDAFGNLLDAVTTHHYYVCSECGEDTIIVEV